ncbi:MAG: hypothetical protein CVT49_01690 [candidate division Zixibacteria bacterium HGW-Zixibacteria-1]|nr:MAG: hypothetical protein CVT49_01690 [candidate division Zixibacteria bacterium HGW-Zixibacteria-1]
MRLKSILFLTVFLSILFALTVNSTQIWSETIVVEGGKSLHWSLPKNCSQAVLKGINWLDDKLIVTDLKTGIKYTLYGKGSYPMTVYKGTNLLLENDNQLNFSIKVTYYSD